MASNKALKVVPQTLPTQKEPDLEDLLASRLADDLMNEVDMGKLTKLAIAHLGKRLRTKAIEWLSADNSARIPLTEVEAIEAAAESVEVAA